MVLRAHRAINQEGNNILTTPYLQEKNEKWLIDTIRKIVKDGFKKHETKMSEMISNNFQDQLEEEINNIKENIKNLETRVKGIKMIFWIQMTYPPN